MRGVGPGTVLGGRYTLHRRMEQLHGVERWSADDTTLGRSVSILCIPVDDHRTPAMLDAARRAASVTHVVFVRILDVGSDDDVAYLVEEDIADARTLASLVSAGGVPGDEVRRITGEVAAALESARQRGMHHLDLTPDDVLRTSDGDIRLRGLETAAVRAGQDGAEDEDAARRDAVGVVALTYAGLTGLWPLGAGGAGLGPAPRVPSGVAAPSEIAAGVPRDLDAICRLTLNVDQGPTSPGDYARQVAPWPSRQVVGRPVTPTARSAPAPVAPARMPDTIEQPASSHSAAAAGGAAGAMGAASAAAAAGAAGAGAGAAWATAGTADVAAESVRTTSPEPFAAEADRASQASSDDGTRPEQGPVDVPGREATRVLPLPAEPDWRSDRSDAHEEDTEPARTGGWDDVRWEERRPPAGSAADVRAPDDAGPRARRDGAGTAAGAAGAAVAGALSGVGGRVGGIARRAVDKVSELSPDSTAGPGVDGLDYPAPMVPAEPLTKDESRLALGIVAGFLVLALIIGIWGVSRIGDSDFSLGGPPAPRTTSAEPSSGAPSATPSEGQSAGSPEPLAILKVEAYDPQGDGEENNRLTPTIYDGDRETGWFSENYRSDKFGGLKKGLGVIVDLGPNKKPQTVELVMAQTADVEVHVGPDNRLEGATKVGEKEGADGTVRFDVPADVSGQYVVVWFTELTADDDGKRRARLNEVVVTG